MKLTRKQILIAISAILVILTIGIVGILALTTTNNKVNQVISSPVSAPLSAPVVAEYAEFDTQASFSLHYANGNLITIDAQGKMAKIVSGDTPVLHYNLAPDNQSILYTLGKSFEGAYIANELLEYDITTGKTSSIVKLTEAAKRVEPNGSPSYIANHLSAFTYIPTSDNILYAVDRRLFLYDTTTKQSTKLAEVEAGNFEKLQFGGSYLLADWFYHEGYYQVVYKFNDSSLTKIAPPIKEYRGVLFYRGCCGDDSYRYVKLASNDFYIYEDMYKNEMDYEQGLVYKVSKWDPTTNSLVAIYTGKEHFTTMQKYDQNKYAFAAGNVYEYVPNTVKVYDANGVVAQFDVTKYPADKSTFRLEPPFVIVQSTATDAQQTIFIIKGASLVELMNSKEVSNLGGSIGEFTLATTQEPNTYFVSNYAGNWTYNTKTKQVQQLR